MFTKIFINDVLIAYYYIPSCGGVSKMKAARSTKERAMLLKRECDEETLRGVDGRFTAISTLETPPDHFEWIPHHDEHEAEWDQHWERWPHQDASDHRAILVFPVQV